MDCLDSAPYFGAATETVADLAYARLVPVADTRHLTLTGSPLDCLSTTSAILVTTPGTMTPTPKPLAGFVVYIWMSGSLLQGSCRSSALVCRALAHWDSRIEHPGEQIESWDSWL
jgi:hypothetical protein